MKISLLKKRENFIDIFQKSTLDFFNKKYPKLSRKNVEYKINDYLNIVYPSSINRNCLSELVMDFKYHPKFYRRILQTAYVFLSIRWPLEKFAYSAKVLIPVPENISERWVFLPGNHSIRVIDLEKNHCFVFIKSGFNKNFFKSNTKIRLENRWLKAPKVIQTKTSWYQEERVTGLSLNRQSSKVLKNMTIIAAQSELLKLYKKTTVQVLIKDYVPKLIQKILSMLNNSYDDLSEKNKKVVINFVNMAKFILINYFSAVKIDLATTHGDFQPANILCSKVDFWIIDWENSNQRSIFYDALVFNLDCRSPLGLSKRLNTRLNELTNMNDYLKWTGQSLDNGKIYYFWIFFLEDLIFRMDEIPIEHVINKSQFLSVFLTELSKINTILSKEIKC